MEETELQKYRTVQNIAKQTMEEISSFIQPGITEAEIAQKCEELMRKQGVSSFWYYGVPALVLVGERTTLSVSGRKYKPTNTKVKETDLVTIDLNPEIDGCWGDYARSFGVLHGLLFRGDVDTKSDSVFEGFLIEEILHDFLEKTAKPDMTFGHLHYLVDIEMRRLSYENLDFKGNFGHSIAKRLEDRIYIEQGNDAELGSVPLFTFEPHIRRKGGGFGYKMEDIYYFENGVLKPL